MSYSILADQGSIKRCIGSYNPLAQICVVLFAFRGICMYRTPKTHELILKGIPDRLRGEIWILFSGTVNEVRLSYMFVRDSLLTSHINLSHYLG